jgi:hypothetical protein
MGVYSSLDNLRKGVDHWREFDPKICLAYLEWELNYAAEPNCWGWAYIPVNSRMATLKSGGGSVPQRVFWGKNLIGVEWVPIVGKDEYVEVTRDDGSRIILQLNEL